MSLSPLGVCPMVQEVAPLALSFASTRHQVDAVPSGVPPFPL